MNKWWKKHGSASIFASSTELCVEIIKQNRNPTSQKKKEEMRNHICDCISMVFLPFFALLFLVFFHALTSQMKIIIIIMVNVKRRRSKGGRGLHISASSTYKHTHSRRCISTPFRSNIFHFCFRFCTYSFVAWKITISLPSVCRVHSV